MKHLYIPFVWELVLIILTIFFPKQAFVLFLAFYLGLLIYFYFINKQFSFRKLNSYFCEVKTFWLPVLVTFAGLFAASKLKDYISQLYPNSYKENVWIIVPNNLIPTIIYACMMIIMKPVAEELFYRKAIIRFGDKKKMILLTVASLLICALSRAHGPVAIMQWILMSLPVTIAYIATKNIYIPIMAHVIFEFWDNTYEIVYSLGRIFFR